MIELGVRCRLHEWARIEVKANNNYKDIATNLWNTSVFTVHLYSYVTLSKQELFNRVEDNSKFQSTAKPKTILTASLLRAQVSGYRPAPCINVSFNLNNSLGQTNA